MSGLSIVRALSYLTSLQAGPARNAGQHVLMRTAVWAGPCLDVVGIGFGAWHRRVCAHSFLLVHRWSHTADPKMFLACLYRAYVLL
eukprot:7227775-Alexandrium_andersonii.AAC.1